MFDEKQILCYFDYDEYPTVYPLIAALAAGVEDDTMKEVCGGFFVDNYAEIEGYAAVNFFDLYIAAQVQEASTNCLRRVFSPTHRFFSVAREREKGNRAIDRRNTGIPHM